MLVFMSGKVTYDWEDYDNMRIGGLPLVKSLERFNGKQVHVCWAFDDKPISPEGFLSIALETQEGQIEAEIHRGWSEVTGEYGWSNCKVGGHDIERVFSEKENRFGAILVSTGPLDLTTCLEADQIVSWFVEK